MSANKRGTSGGRAQTKAKRRPNKCYRVAGISANGHTTEQAQIDTDTNQRLGTPGSGNKRGRAQMSTQMSRDKWGRLNEGDEGEHAGMSANKQGTSANKGQTKAKQVLPGSGDQHKRTHNRAGTNECEHGPHEG